MRAERNAFAKQQAGLNETNSIFAGIVANNDNRIWKNDTYVSGDMESFTVLTSATPGSEKVIGIARSKALLPNTYGIEELFQQFKTKYGTVYSPNEYTASMARNQRGFEILSVNDKILTTSDKKYSECFGPTSFRAYMTNPNEVLEAPLPSRVGGWCGTQLSLLITPFSDNNSRYAEGYSIYLVDAGAVFKVSQERVSAAKKMMDGLNRDTLKATPKEKL